MILAFELVQVPVAPPQPAAAMRKPFAVAPFVLRQTFRCAGQNLPLHTGWVWSVSDSEGDTEKGRETKTSIQTI